MRRSSNPALKDSIFQSERTYGVGESMTLQGTVNKTFILLGLVVIAAYWIWSKVMQPVTIFDTAESLASKIQAVTPFMIGGALGGFVLAMVTIFKRQWAGITAPLYALAEGVFIGGISAIFELQYPGIVIQAVSLTFGTLASLLLVYKSGLIKVTDNFRLGVVAATGAIALIYFVSIIMSFFGASIPMIHSSGTFGILFSLFVIGIAALNLVLDFDFIEKGAQMGAPKYMEWYGAFGLMVTLIWLYIEFLRLLSKMRQR